MKIIITGIDGSEHSIKAASLAADLAAERKATLELVYAIPPAYFPVEAYGPVLVEVDRIQQEEAERTLKKVVAQLQRPGLEIRAEVLNGGSPARLIADRAEAKNAEMIVVGSRGRGALSRTFLGSVSSTLLHISKKPVLVVP